MYSKASFVINWVKMIEQTEKVYKTHCIASWFIIILNQAKLLLEKVNKLIQVAWASEAFTG